MGINGVDKYWVCSCNIVHIGEKATFCEHCGDYFEKDKEEDQEEDDEE